MIITSIHAENVLKYSVLELDNIPEQGLISVTGDNESGKSSIGESICFALFGRTFSLGPDELDKVIRWGESRCSIRLGFVTPDRKRYQISRFLDKQGNHGASISLIGEDPLVRGVDEVAEQLRAIIGFGYLEFVESFYLAQREISTPNPHSFAVKAMAGVDAMEKAITSCEAESQGFSEQRTETEAEKAKIDGEIATLNLVQGHLEALQTKHQDLSDQIQHAHQRIRELAEHTLLAKKTGDRLLRGAKAWMAVKPGLSYNNYLDQAGKLDTLLTAIDPVWEDDSHTTEPVAGLRSFATQARRRLQVFDALRERASKHKAQLRIAIGESAQPHPDEADAQPLENGQTAAAGETLITQQQQLQQQQQAQQSERRYWRIALTTCILGAIALAGWWWLLGHPPAQQQIPGADWAQLPALLDWLPIVAAVLAVFAISSGWYALRLSGRLRQTQQQLQHNASEQATARDHIERLQALDDTPLPQALTLLGELQDPVIADRAGQFRNGPGRTLLDETEHGKHQLLLRRKVVTTTDALQQFQRDASDESSRLDAAIISNEKQREDLKKDIDIEQERVRQHLELTAVASNLDNRLQDLSRRMQVRELGVDLLNGAIHYISQRFNTEVRNLSADSLLKFTNDRYEHLQIDEDLNVKAFSAEKRDFMQLDEISSGTQRQIMLAVRMSLSQKLVNSVIQGPQSLFLDEPFAFFDEDRTASSLAVLPEVSGDFTQIWVTSQKFPARSHFDIHIECNARESESPWVRAAGEG